MLAIYAKMLQVNIGRAGKHRKLQSNPIDQTIALELQAVDLDHFVHGGDQFRLDSSARRRASARSCAIGKSRAGRQTRQDPSASLAVTGGFV